MQQKSWQPAMGEEKRVWDGLGIFDTIYEEEDFSPSPPFSSPSFSSAPLSWSKETSSSTNNVIIHVQGSSFRKNKETLVARSGYLKQKLNKMTEITLSPPLKITAETFAAIADYCDGDGIGVTPYNVAALRVATELLDMTDGLVEETETYFRRSVSTDRDHALIVLRSCVPLLPEAETTAFLVSRCLEELRLTVDLDDDKHVVVRCMDSIKEVEVDDFLMTIGSMSRRLLTWGCDLLYRIIDFYLKEYKGKITEDQRARICNYVECSNLSVRCLVDAVQNPRMPLRLIIQAMFVEQLHTRHSFHEASATAGAGLQRRRKPPTLGSVLGRDAAIRHAEEVKARMEDASSRIRDLEEQVSGMRRLLDESDQERAGGDRRCESFRVIGSEKKVGRTDRGSVSFGSFRILRGKERETSMEEMKSWRSVESKIGRRLMSGLKKSVLRVSTAISKKKTTEN